MKKILIALLLFTKLHAQNFDSLKMDNPNLKMISSIENFEKQVKVNILIVHSQTIKYKDQAQLFIVLKTNENIPISFYNIEDKIIFSCISNGSYVLANLPNDENFICKNTITNEVIGEVSTVSFKKGENFTASSVFFKAVNGSVEFKEGKKHIIEVMDENPKIDYFEKLAFIQAHVLQGEYMPEKMKIIKTSVTDDLLFSKIEPQLRKKSRGDDFPWDISEFDTLKHHQEWWNPGGGTLEPSDKINCRATFVLKTKDEVSFGTSATTTANGTYIPYFNVPYSNPIFYEILPPAGQQSIGGWPAGTNYEVNNGNYYKGASVSRWLSNHGWISWGINPGQQMAAINDSNINYQTIYMSIWATSGFYYRKECGCQKPVNVKMFYESQVYARTNTLGAASNTNGTAHVQDYALGFITDLHSGKVELLDAGIVEEQLSCAVSLNPDWTKNLTDLAKSTLTLASTIATAGGASIGTIATIASGTNSLTFVSDLIAFVNTPKHLYDGYCGSKVFTEKLVDAAKDIYLEPNEAIGLTITSGQRMEVKGKKHWQSDASVNSKSFIGTFIYKNAYHFGSLNTAECCTREAGVYLQTGLNNFAEDQNKYKLDNYYYTMGNMWEPQYTFGGDPKVYGNFGRMFGSLPDGCNKIIIKGRFARPLFTQLSIIKNKGSNIANYPDEFIGGTYSIYNIGGELVAKGIINTNSLSLDEVLNANGNLFILKITHNNNSLTQKFIKNDY
jgi:hypothetical protein